jgi:hypothetical protein
VFTSTAAKAEPMDSINAKHSISSFFSMTALQA